MMNSKKRKVGATTETPARKTPPWAVMVYMASDNNLAEECVFSLTEIQRTLHPAEASEPTDEDGNVLKADLAVLAQFDSRVTGIGTKRYAFGQTTSNSASATDGKQKTRLSDFAVKVAGDPFDGPPPDSPPGFLLGGKKETTPPFIEENSASPVVLENFLTAGIKTQPAQHYLVLLSGHGSGILEGFLSDSDPSGSLSIPNLGIALGNVKKICADFLGKELDGELDILGMDCCLMSMVEVCHELSGIVRYLIGSEGFSLSSGWPYRNILQALQKNNHIAPKTLAETIVREYLHYYSDFVAAGISADQSACDLSKSPGLVTAVCELVNALTEELSSGRKTLKPDLLDPLIVAHWRAQSYEFEQFVDLKDFCECLKDGCQDEKVQSACKKVIRKVNEMVLIFGYCGGQAQYSNGLSIYFPWAKSELEIIKEYQSLRFAKETGWGLFLAAYVRDTQRQPRQRKTKFQAGTRTLLPVSLFPSNPAAVRTNNAAGTKTNNAAGTKTNNAAGTKTNNAAGTKSVVVITPQVKNPPDFYYDYEDNCAEARR